MAKKIPTKRKKYANADWAAIEADYELGLNSHDLSRKYQTPQSTIASRIKNKGWTRSNLSIKALDEFDNSVKKITDLIATADTEAQALAISENINQSLIENSLGAGNRVLLQQTQAIIASAFKKNKVDIKNVNEVARTLATIETVINPQAKTRIAVVVNNTDKSTEQLLIENQKLEQQLKPQITIEQ